VTALLVSYSGHFGGGERLLADYAGALHTESVLACPEGPLAEHARAAGQRVIPLPRRALELRGGVQQRIAAATRLAAHGAEVRRLVRDLRPGLLVASGMRSALALGALPLPFRGRPWTVFLHNDLLPSPLVGRLVRAASRRFDRVVALSGAVAGDLDPHGALGGRLRVCHPGVDLERFPALPAPASPGQALLLGAIVDWKRPDLALEALALASGRLPQARLVVAGAPLDEGGNELQARLRARIDKPDLRGRVRLAGPVDSVGALRESSCLLHCADQEPFGLVVLEALACGRPVVAPAAGGPAELVDDSVGRLYEPGSAVAAADALVEVLSDPQATLRMGAAARRRAEERHDVASARRRWLEAVGGPALRR
jgi:glycosyltransferase involved in cell wall biosynthesis